MAIVMNQMKFLKICRTKTQATIVNKFITHSVLFNKFLNRISFKNLDLADF